MGASRLANQLVSAIPVLPMTGSGLGHWGEPFLRGAARSLGGRNEERPPVGGPRGASETHPVMGRRQLSRLVKFGALGAGDYFGHRHIHRLRYPPHGRPARIEATGLDSRDPGQVGARLHRHIFLRQAFPFADMADRLGEAWLLIRLVGHPREANAPRALRSIAGSASRSDTQRGLLLAFPPLPAIRFWRASPDEQRNRNRCRRHGQIR